MLRIPAADFELPFLRYSNASHPRELSPSFPAAIPAVFRFGWIGVRDSGFLFGRARAARFGPAVQAFASAIESMLPRLRVKKMNAVFPYVSEVHPMFVVPEASARTE